MATIKFLLQSKNNPANIYLRLSIDRKTVLKRKSGYVINPNYWSNATNLPKQGDETLKELKNSLGKLAMSIETNLNKATANKEEITGDWLQEQIDACQGKKKKTDLDRLTNYIQHYIEKLPYKTFSGGKTGVVHNTIQKYTTLKNKIVEFEKYQKKRFYIKDVGLKFGNELTKYFLEVDKLSANSTGRYVKYLKSVCNDAKENGIETHPQLKSIRGISSKSSKIYLTFDELQKIENKTYGRAALINAKDWLIIGCYIGQRVSDLLSLTSKNINVRNGRGMIELVQQKTGKKVAIPIHPKVQAILDKRNGKFPNQIPAQKFNLHIKDLCKIAEINFPIQGGKMSKETKRKEFGVFPKHELITSHVCRRSFASNYYGELPTALLKSITGHSTEQQFLEYIGKTTNDYATQIAEYWDKEYLKANEKAPMTVLRKAE